MKTNKIIFWVSTIPVAGMMLMSSFMYLSHSAQVMEGYKTLGFPLFFINLLGTAKLLGSIALLQPMFAKLREWAYAGFTFVLIGAAWTHIASGVGSPIFPIVLLLVLAVSYFYNMKLQDSKLVK